MFESFHLLHFGINLNFWKKFEFWKLNGAKIRLKWSLRMNVAFSDLLITVFMWLYMVLWRIHTRWLLSTLFRGKNVYCSSWRKTKSTDGKLSRLDIPGIKCNRWRLRTTSINFSNRMWPHDWRIAAQKNSTLYIHLLSLNSHLLCVAYVHAK